MRFGNFWSAAAAAAAGCVGNGDISIVGVRARVGERERERERERGKQPNNACMLLSSLATHALRVERVDPLDDQDATLRDAELLSGRDLCAKMQYNNKRPRIA